MNHLLDWLLGKVERESMGDNKSIKMEESLKQILSHALFGTPLETSVFDEANLIKELEQQTVLSIVGKCIESLPFSDQAKQYCICSSMGKYAFAHRLLYEQSLLIDLMKENEIPMAILKGSAAAINYPEPAYRTFGDVDFIVPEMDFSRAYQLMLENGYVMSYDEDHVDYHYTLQKEAITFELHKHPAGLPEDSRQNLIMNQLREDLLQPEETELEGYRIPILPVVSNGLVLLLHIRKHLQGGLGLRQIIDWMMFVDKHLGDHAWEQQFQVILEESKLDTLAKTVTKMCQMNLGLRKNILWCQNASDQLCDALWRYVMEKGNFGRKEGIESKGKNFISYGYNMKELFLHLQHQGERNWKLLRKYPWLKCFAWLHHLGICMQYVFQRKTVIKSLKSDLEQGGSRAKMIKKLM